MQSAIGGVTPTNIGLEKRHPMRPQVNPDPLRDVQQNFPVGYCPNCGAELYGYDEDGVCELCKEVLDGG